MTCLMQLLIALNKSFVSLYRLLYVCACLLFTEDFQYDNDSLDIVLVCICENLFAVRDPVFFSCPVNSLISFEVY